MLKRFHRWMSTPLAIVLLGLVIVAWTWATLGAAAGWRMAVVLVALGAADALLGAVSKPLSLEVWRAWRRSSVRYWLWVVGMAVAALLLHLHFTGLGR